MIASSTSKSPIIFVESPASSRRFGFKSAALSNHAGLVAGVFFGRLNRRFGREPSRRFSGPSAEFISVNRLDDGALPSAVPLFAPMNNPYLRLRLDAT
jgi:hypothetical protein